MRRTALLMAASGLAAAALVLVVTSWRRSPGPAPAPMAFPVAAPPETHLEQVVISPDGRSLAFTAGSASGTNHLWVRELQSRDARQLEGTDGARTPFWSPDSRFIGFFTEERLSSIEVATGVSQTLGEVGTTRGGAWNRDGVIVFAGSLRLSRVAAGGGKVSDALLADVNAGENDLRYPSFLPDGKHVLFYSRNPKNRAMAGLWVASIDTGARKHLTAEASSSAVGQRVRLKLDAHPDVAFHGTIASIWSTVQERSWRDPIKVVRLDIDLESTDPQRMRPGMRFRGGIEVDRVEGAVVVPADAVFLKEDGPVAFRRTAFGWERCSVRLGRRSETQVEVLEGVREGDRVARVDLELRERGGGVTRGLHSLAGLGAAAGAVALVVGLADVSGVPEVPTATGLDQ